MEPRISSVTIFVDDLSRSFEFYRRLFEIPHEQMVIHEDHVAFFFENDLSLVLLENVGAKASQMMLTHAAEFADDVDAILQRVVAAGGQVVQWPEKDASSYAALFEDPDGHLWEAIAWM
ncbi:VOC family protein [Geomicrobium sp. JCM 19039]|uniref:VOC family protein n=1 Tax=Geomicrobium sp. JCM 19039 TaxID=1460636 RepID=UPI00045F404C|nr:VOC family protein [Geomicrobium sp. JCM 19039]GAK13165.1 lactoylglutathione lyase [Geomicrobium sp. JCM 19039]